MSTLNDDADSSGGKPATTDASATSMSSNNANIFGAPSAGADSSFALLQQVQTILLENNQAKTRMIELESQVASFQKEREELVCKMEESEKASNQSIENIQQQLSQKEEEWAKKFETQENIHESSLKNLQEKLDDWESQHQDWTARENEYQQNIGNLEESKSQLQASVQQLETDLEVSKAEVSRLQTEQADTLKNHEEILDGLNSQIESIQKELEAQGLQKEQDQRNHQEQENELKQTLDEFRATIQEKETLVQSLEGTIDELRLEASQLNQDHQTQVEEMEAAISNLELENVVQSKQASEDYQTQIEKLQQEMDSLHSVILKQQKKAEEKEQEAEKHKLDEEQQQQLQEEQEDSKWQELVQSLQIQVQAQTSIAETKSQELEDSKSQNMQLRVQIQVLTQQKEQLEKNWTETKEKLRVLEDQPAKQSETTENDDSTQEEQVNQDQIVSTLTEENERLHERIVQMEAQLVLGNARGFDHSESKEDYNDHANNNNDDTIAQLQQRIMHLVEEKLILQTAVETLEHQLMDSNLLERNASSRQLQEKQRSPAATMKDYLQKGQKQLQEKLEQEPPPKIVVDENTKQADIIRLTMQHRQSQKLSRRISNTVLGTPTVSKPVQQIDVKVAERMFLEQQQKQELLKKAKNNSKRTNSSDARTRSTEIGRSSWIRSRDLGLGSEDPASNENNKTTDLPGYTASNQHGFVKSAMGSSSTTPASKKEKTTTWTRIRDSISGPKSGEKGSKIEPTNADDFSLWVQELNREQQQSGGGTEESKQNEEFKSLSEPASMLDSLPPAPSSPLNSTAGRYAVQTLDDLLNGGMDAMLEGMGNKNSKQQKTREPQTYRVLDPTQKKPKEVPKVNDAKPVIGEGHTIDQSSLLGFYVHKQKEAANATTIGYLSSMIYGDPDEEEVKIQRKLLKRQLARKKKQEEKEREQLEKEVKASIRPPVGKEPKTIFSSFI